MARKAILRIVSGPNDGDTLSIDEGSCRLVGRHLSDSETALMDRDGNRLLDGPASDILSEHLRDRAPNVGINKPVESLSVTAFDRGADIILGDDSISRAHAMIFLDKSGLGVIDLASTNGTYVNRDRVNSCIMNDGDILTVGNSDIEVAVR